MSMRRAAPGPQLSTGRIRVDAARAIAKLREYQLADRSAWVLEGIRAAVAAGATRIALRGDANDIWLSWEGEPWPDDVLPRLFDELVSPEPVTEMERAGFTPALGKARHHVRLLAAAVNSALGMAPAYVDVIAIHAGTARRVRYTPEILVEPASELGDAALRHVAVDSIAPPDQAMPGMLVHMRRRLADWRLLGEPPELGLARDACRDIAVPLHVGDVVLHRDTANDVLRIPLGEGLDGFIAITEPERATGSAVLEIAERGVVLAEYALELLDGKQRGPNVPIRVFVDAPRMPTNASRSQVRRDTHPIASAERRAHKLAPELIAQLAAAVKNGSERARASALTLIATLAGGPRWHVDVPSIRGPLREVVQLPIVRNAVGQPRALSTHWRAEVHTGARAFAPELAPWLENVLWAPPGDPARQLLLDSEVDTRGTRRLARWARKQHRAHKKFYAHEKREIRVLTSETPYIRASLGCAVERSAVGDDLFTGLTGDVCIYREGKVGALVVLLEGRELERVEFDSPLAFDVVIDSKTVEPADRYRGVERDAEYKRVERAMRAGLVRALEAHALGRGAKVRSEDAADDTRLLRRGFGVLGELGVPVRGPLAAAPAYRAVDGTWKSLAELAKLDAIGVAEPERRVAVPRGRVVLELAVSERDELAQLVPGRIVPYRRETAVDTRAMTNNLAVQGGGALVIREPGLVAALTPAWHAGLRLFHLGVELDERSYTRQWLSCAIAIDCDDIVPDENWNLAIGDAGLGDRDYAAWELALVRAIAGALVGEPQPELVRAGTVELHGKLGTALCAAIAEHDVRELLGDDLLAKLRAVRLVRVLGHDEPWSIDDLAAVFPDAIPYVALDTEPVVGFTPMIASRAVAHALCKLVGRDATEGSAQLERRRREALRDLRLAAHRLKEQQPLVVPAEHHVGLASPRARGVVGAWLGEFEIRVFVEGRPFTVIRPNDRDLPLVAAIDIAAEDCDDTFEAVSEDIARVIATEVRAVAPALLVEIAKRQPELLGDEGAVRTLLARTHISGEEARKTLVEAPAWITVQGERMSIAKAGQPFISVASWQGEWLRPEGEAEDPYDRPAFYVPEDKHEIARIIDKLHPFAIADVTEGVSKLQARRRMARGLLPQPRVRPTDAAFVRSLASLGALAKSLGHGEIALVESQKSQVLAHEHGSFMRAESIDVMPAVEIALEAPDLAGLRNTVQELAVELARQVLAAVDPAALPPAIQRNLRRAALAKRLPPTLLTGMPLWQDFVTQHEELGDVWVLCEPSALEPLDPNRRVFHFERNDFELARQHGWNVVDAAKELALDNVARKNRARRRATSLELPTRLGVLAEVLLDGDGVTSPRGVVAVLAPTATTLRGVYSHVAMHPLDPVDDPCRWPTLAVIDDARITPDRTWQKPVANAAWQAIGKELRAASERALATVGEVPEHALVHMKINNAACADVGPLRKSPKSQIRGVLWLAGTPRDTIAVQVIGPAKSVWSFVPAGKLAMGGKLFVFAPDKLDVEVALDQLCAQSHPKLVRALVKQDPFDKDLMAAHVAHALAERTLRPTDVRGVEFPCFSPRPLDARALTSLLRADHRVTVIRPGTAPNPSPDVIELVDDGSELATTLIADLGLRVQRVRPAPTPRPAPEAPPVVATSAPTPALPAPELRKPEPPHPLQGLVAKLRKRLADLGIGGYDWRIEDRAEPMFRFDHGIEVAGHNVRLSALAAALATKSPFANAGVDVVIAHLVTVLNVSLTQITDASEAHALGVLLSQPSASQPRSRRSS